MAFRTECLGCEEEIEDDEVYCDECYQWDEDQV